MTEEKNNTVIPRLFSYQGNFDRLAVGFGQLVQMAEVNRFDADFQPVDNIGRNAGKLFDLRQRQIRSVESSSGEAANRLRCSPVDERLSDSVNRKTYRTNSGIAQLARNAVSDFDDFVVFGCHYVQLLHVLLKQNRPFVWKRREELQTVTRQRTNSSAKAAYIVPSSLAGG